MHVVPSLDSGGGAEQLVYRIVQRMKLSGNPPVVCCLRSLGDLGCQLQKEGVNVYFQETKGTFDISQIFWMSRIIKSEKVRVVHAHMYSPFVYSVPAAFISGGIKVVYTEHGRLYPEKKKWKRRLINPLWALGVDCLVAISEKTKSAMALYDFYPEKRIKVIHNGIEYKPNCLKSDAESMRVDFGLDANCRIVGTAARLEDIKNIPMMLRAFREVLEVYPDVYLVIAGDGSKSQELKELSERLTISKRVRFLGLRNDLQNIYPLFDIFLLSSFTEGISVSLLEAMSCSLPAVVTDVGGNSEVVIEGVTGYLVPSDDDSSMAARILDLLNNQEQAISFGKNGQGRAQDDFSFDGMMDAYMKIYTS